MLSNHCTMLAMDTAQGGDIHWKEGNINIIVLSLCSMTDSSQLNSNVNTNIYVRNQINWVSYRSYRIVHYITLRGSAPVPS